MRFKPHCAMSFKSSLSFGISFKEPWFAGEVNTVPRDCGSGELYRGSQRG